MSKDIHPLLPENKNPDLLLGLPQEVLHKLVIDSYLATTSLSDIGNIRQVSKFFADILSDEKLIATIETYLNDIDPRILENINSDAIDKQAADENVRSDEQIEPVEKVESRDLKPSARLKLLLESLLQAIKSIQGHDETIKKLSPPQKELISLVQRKQLLSIDTSFKKMDREDFITAICSSLYNGKSVLQQLANDCKKEEYRAKARQTLDRALSLSN